MQLIPTTLFALDAENATQTLKQNRPDARRVARMSERRKKLKQARLNFAGIVVLKMQRSRVMNDAY